MAGVNVRRLAAIDMYGVRGTTRRRRIILAEFLAGVVVMVAFGIWLVASASGPGARIFGIGVIGAGLNYPPLAAYAIALSRAARSTRSWQTWTPAGSCAAAASSSFGSSCLPRSSSSP